VKNHLIVFTRYPEPGKTKTRLIPALGAEGAARLQQRMTERTLYWVRQLASRKPVKLRIAYEGGDESRFSEWLGSDIAYHRQCEGDLGRRMAAALERAFSEGAEAAVILGTDIPELNSAIVESALRLLTNKNLVLGPASDGGYYLVGISNGRNIPWKDLFSGIPWGTDLVFSKTVEKVQRLGISIGLTSVLSDVDEPAHLGIWARRTHPQVPGPSIPRISIIIPTLNEADHIEKTLWSTLSMEHTEVIVSDGGSRDETVHIARKYGVRVLEGAPGRALQMNAGARAAAGAIFIFLHGDTRLSPGADLAVEKALGSPDVAAGAFSLSIDALDPGLRFIEKAANFRARYLQLPYGDQGIFMRRHIFLTLGGFAELPIMEDAIMMRRARRLGRIVLLPEAVATSGRRWLRHGIIRTTLINQLILFGYGAGICPQYLARFYRKSRA
jgi:uncharacterized protein